MAADLGEAPPEITPAFEYAIVATSVAIPKTLSLRHRAITGMPR
jgi:hypothetical protein